MYEKFLTNQAIIRNWQTLYLLAIFLSFRLLSFALAGETLVQAVLVFIFILIFGVIYYKNQTAAWYIILGELLLGGAGHFFEFFGLSLRTLLFISFILLWTIQTIASGQNPLNQFPRRLYSLLAGFGGFVVLSVFLGLTNQHGLKAVVSDFIPYAYFLLVFPAYHILQKKSGQAYLVRLLTVFLIGSALFALYTFIVFSVNLEFLQSPYYKWFRDIALGKITDLGGGFWRVVVPEHLLVAPLTVLIASLLMRREKNHPLWYALLLPALLILALNLSRAYLLGLVGGILLLKLRHGLKRWALVGGGTILLFIALFSSINLISSGGQTAGLDILGVRLGGLTRPATETSATLRAALLNPIFKMIGQHPWLGSGLGSRLIFIHPKDGRQFISQHFDWGYLEMWVELGLAGTLAYLILIGAIALALIKKIRSAPDYIDFYVGLLGGLAALLIINVTTPALFHVLGVFYLVFVLTIAAKDETILDNITYLLYQTFHRLKS